MNEKFNLGEADSFYADIRKVGNSLIVTIPSNLIKGLAIKEGDLVKLLLKKEKKKEGETNVR